MAVITGFVSHVCDRWPFVLLFSPGVAVCQGQTGEGVSMSLVQTDQDVTLPRDGEDVSNNFTLKLKRADERHES